MSYIKRPSEIAGYQHPVSYTYSKNSMYKTFTSGTNETFKHSDEFDSTEKGKQYANYLKDDDELCKICNQQPVKICPCAYNDKTCSNGHTWYTDREGKVCQGDPHKK